MSQALEQAVGALRRFNRFHTRFSGVLDASFMGSGLSLLEARVLFEIATRAPIVASAIQAELGLDRGYLSRIVGRFERRGWIVRERGEDARRRPMALTGEGRRFFEALDARTHDHVADAMRHLCGDERDRLVDALDLVTRLLSRDGAPR